MACLKCGKKTKDEHVFCPACLTAMEAYPVKQELHVHLPLRKERELPKRTRKRRILSDDEQLAVLKKRQRRMIAAIVLLVMLLGAAVGLLVCSQTTPEALPWNKNQTTTLPTE